MKITRSHGLSGNAIKLIAAFFMVIDHAALVFYNFKIITDYNLYLAMRALGRIALPLFAFMIAEGCRYTKNKFRYFLTLFSIGVICTAVYYISTGGAVYLTVMTTFSFSVAMIFAYDKAAEGFKEKDGGKFFCYACACLAVIAGAYITDKLCDATVGTSGVPGTLDYGVTGAILPLSAYIIKNKWLRLIPFGLCLAASFLTDIYYAYPVPVQWVGMFALVILAFYGGQRGRAKLKYFFYIFYPVHLALLEGIAMLITYII